MGVIGAEGPEITHLGAMRVDDAKQIPGTNTDRDPAAGRHTVSVAEQAAPSAEIALSRDAFRRRKYAVCKTSPSLSLFTAATGSAAGGVDPSLGTCFHKVPALSSRKAS